MLLVINLKVGGQHYKIVLWKKVVYYHTLICNNKQTLIDKVCYIYKQKSKLNLKAKTKALVMHIERTLTCVLMPMWGISSSIEGTIKYKP